MLKVALPRPSFDAVIRGEGRSASRNAFFDDEELPVRAWSRAEAQDLAKRQPALSPWWVVLSQVGVGTALALAIGLVSGSMVAAQSAFYGAAVVAVPSALMARGATSPLSSLSPLTSAVSMMGWATVKLAASVAMLAVAPRIVPGLDWPVMLASLVICMQTYSVALLWRRRPA